MPHKELTSDIDQRLSKVEVCNDGHLTSNGNVDSNHRFADHVEPLIIDEAERLTPTALELLRDLHDRSNIAVILISMPGVDQRFRHYAQLHIRLGFAHQYRALGRDEMLFVLDRRWKRLGKRLDVD